MAGLNGFEPLHAGVKVQCLTAWRQPNNDTKKIISNFSLSVKGFFHFF